MDKFHLKNLRQLKQKYPHLKVLMALGGATLSKAFSDMAAKEDTRQKFVKSCLDLYLGNYPDVIDGFDMVLDLEKSHGSWLVDSTSGPRLSISAPI